jgi:hypothetical protein
MAGQRSWLFLCLFFFSQEFASAVPGDGIPPALVTSSEGKLVLRIDAPREGVYCEVYKDMGQGGSIMNMVYDGPCNQQFTLDNLIPDRNFRFQSRARDGSNWGGRGEAITYVSAGIPDWQSVLPLVEKVGADSIRISWRPPYNGGSTILGYHVDMEANGDNVFQRVYDGSNRPSVLSYSAWGLHMNLKYRFKLYAENRVGMSSPVEVSVRVANLMAAYSSRVTTMMTKLSADVAQTVLLQAVDPVTGFDERVGGRQFVLSIHDVCELDPTKTLCVRVKPPHPDYAPSLLGQPVCCISSVDLETGPYRMTYTLRKAGKYSVLMQALESGGLLGQYWDNQWLYGDPVVTRQDVGLDFDWGLKAIALHASDFVSARWTGYILPAYSEVYTFYVDVDDAARLWINDKLLFDKWDECCQEFFGEVELQAAELASIRLEYREVAGNAKLKLQWSSFSQVKAPIASGKLFKAPFISGVPVTVEVASGAVSAENSIGYGEYLTNVRALNTRTFFIQAQDSANNIMRSNSDVFAAAFNGPAMVSAVSRPVLASAMDGLYQVEYMVQKAGVYGVAITLNGQQIKDSPFTLHARPGRVSAGDSTTEGGGISSFVAGSLATFYLQARDAYANPSDEDVGNVTVAIEWEQYTTSTTMSVANDASLNSAEFGKYFWADSINYEGSGKYLISYTALRQGRHKMYVKVNGENVKGSPYVVSGHPAVAAYGPKSIVEALKPPSTGYAGTEISFQVQLRDAYGNRLDGTPEADTPVFVITSPPPTTNKDIGSCIAKVGHPGLFDCRVLPTIAGDRQVSVQVGGVEVSQLVVTQPLSRVTANQGPFPIYVEPAIVSTVKTYSYGLQPSYTAGVYVPARVQLRDRFSNNRTKSQAKLNFKARFGPTYLSYVDHDNGTITIDVGTPLSGGHPLTVQLDGTVIGNNPTPEITVAPSVARFDGTICHIPPHVTAGIQTVFQCDPRDTYGNDVNDPSLKLMAEFKNMQYPDEPMVTVLGTYSSVDGNFNFALEIPKTGNHSVVAQLWAKGGLIGQYYRTPGFQSLVSLLSDRLHQGLPLSEYTRVDPQMDFLWTGTPVLTCPADYFSVRWYGYLLPKSSGIHTIRVEADYGVRVLVGSTYVIDALNSTIAVRQAAQVSLVNNVGMKIEISYKHQAGTSYFRLYWASTEFEDQKVPPENLLHPLNVLPRDTTTVVRPQEASSKSTATGNVLETAVSGFHNTFILHTRDAQDNARNLPTTSALSGYVAASPAVTLAFTYLGGGNYTVSFNPYTAGSFKMHVLVNGQEIVGSPFDLTVVPGPTSAVHTKITGTGISRAIAGIEAFFFVTLRDAQFNDRKSSLDQVVRVDDVRIACVDQGGGVYRCSYMLTIAQTFHTAVRVNSIPVNPVLPYTFQITVNPKTVDPTLGLTYMFSFTTFYPEFRRGTSNPVKFAVRDDFGNRVPESDNIFLICELDGPERKSAPYRVPLDCHRYAPGLFSCNLYSDTTGNHKGDCYIAKKGGVNARYFNNRWVEGVPAINRVDTTIDFNYGEGLVSADASDFVSAQWDGYLQVPKAANYTFHITCDDGAKMWLDDELVLSRDAPGEYQTRPILLTGTRLYHIQFMYYERTGAARMKVEWSSNKGLSKVVIAPQFFYHSRFKLGRFPQYSLVYDKPGPVEAFYHYDFEYNKNKLRWVPPQDNGGFSIVGYKIFRDQGPGTAIDQMVLMTDAKTFEFEQDGLITEWPYYYRIMASNRDDGEPVIISAQPSVPPVKPVPALLIGTGSGAMTFRITPYVGAAAGWATVVRYTIYRNDGLGGVLRYSYQGDMLGTTVADTATTTIGGLVSGRTYVFQTTLWTRIAQSPMSNAVSILCCEFRKPGSPPLNLRREGTQSDQRIGLAWDAVTDIGSSSLVLYRVYLDDGNTEISKNTAHGLQTHEFFEYLFKGGVYRISVAAVNAAGEGPRSDRLTLIASDIATMPENVQVPVQSKSLITISWTIPSLPGAAGINGYKVFADDGMGGPISNLIYDGSTKASTFVYEWAPRFSDGSVALLAGHSYRFQVQAVNPTGDGIRSEIVTGLAASKPFPPTKPAPDRALTNEGQIVLTWEAPDDGGSPILGYVVEKLVPVFKGGDIGFVNEWMTLTPNPDTVQYTLTTFTDKYRLQKNFVYTYRVSAYNLIDTGETQYSPESVIACAAIPTAPVLTFVTSTETTITVSWDIPLSDLVLTGYKLYVDKLLKYDGNGIPTVRTFTLAGCATGSMRDFRVSALSGAGESSQSSYLARMCARRPYPPGPPTLKSSSRQFIEIKWLPPTDNGGVAITGFKVQRSNHDVFFFGTVQCKRDGKYNMVLPADVHDCLDDTAYLCPQRTCKYRVLALNGIEDNNFADVSPYLIATAAAKPNPPAVVSRDIPPTSATSLEVHWSAVIKDTDTGGALVTGYRVYANTGIGDVVSNLVFDGSGSPSIRSFRHTGLVPGRRYRYQVTAISTSGEGKRSEVSTFLAAAPPSAPQKPRFVDANSNEIHISLDPPASDGGSTILKYVVHVNENPIEPNPLQRVDHVCNTMLSVYPIANLLGGREYQIQVQAYGQCPSGEAKAPPLTAPSTDLCNEEGVNECGIPGAISTMSLFTSTALPSALIIEAVAGTATKTTLTFGFDAPESDGGSPITSFEPYRDDGLGGDYVKVDVLPTSYSEPETALSVVSHEYKYAGLITGRRYNFHIAACNRRGCKSGFINGPIAIAGPPDIPKAPRAVRTSSNPPFVDLEWTPPDNGGLPISRTEISRDDGNMGMLLLLSTVYPPYQNFSDKTVIGGRTYRYRLKVYNERAASQYSFLSTITAAGLPSQVAIPEVVNQTKTAITVSWTVPGNNGADVYQFIVRRDDGLGSSLTQVYRGAGLQFTSTGLATNRWYSFTVAARNAAGEGIQSEPLRVISASMPSRVGVPILLESSCAGGSIRFKWTRPDDDGGCRLWQYRIVKDGKPLPASIWLATTLVYNTGGLDCGAQHQWSVQVRNCLRIWGSDSPVLTSYTASLPERVTGLNATHVSSTELLYSWTPLTGTTQIGSIDHTILRGYELWLDDGIGGRFRKAYDGFNKPFQVSEVVSGLVPARSYRAYVRALNVVGASRDSEILYKSMSVEPAAPGQLSVASAGLTAVACTWKPPNSDGGSAVLHYILEYAPEPLFNVWQKDGPYPDNTQTVKTIFGLAKGTLYQFRIRAVTSAGKGRYSQIVSHIVGSPPTAAPTGLTRMATSSVSLTWGWQPLPEAYTGGAPLNGYRLYMNTGRQDVTELIYDGADRPSVTEFTPTSLACGRTYLAEISAVTRIGEGPRSPPVNFTLAHTPSQPRSARGLSSSTASITIAWDVPQNIGCAEMHSYRVERDGGNGFEKLLDVKTPTQTLTDSSSLIAGKMYIYRISARNVAMSNFGPHSDYITAYAAGFPSAVSNIGYVSSTRTSITLQWDAPSKSGGATIDGYRVQVDDGLGGDFVDASVVTETYAIIESLNPGRPYRFRIAAETVVGSGPYAPVYRQVVASVPGPPIAATLGSVPGYNDRVQVSWPEPADDGGSLILGYKVVFNGTCDRYDGTGVASITSVQILCTTGVRESISVQARNIIGWGPPSPAVDRMCGASPGVPSNLRLLQTLPPSPLDMADTRTPTSMQLAWDAPKETGGLPIKSYQLYRDAGDASGVYTLAYAGLANNVTIHSLTNGRVYRFYAVALNDIGAGERGAVFGGEMRCTPRPIVAAPYKVSGSPWAISFSWPETSDTCGAAVSHYRIYRNGHLMYPVSNTFKVDPVLDGAATTDSVTMVFTPKLAGKLWMVVIVDDHPFNKPLEVSAQRVKSGTLAQGRATCQLSGKLVLGGSVAIRETLYGCQMTTGVKYAAFVYVESNTGMEDDGTLSSAINFYVPVASNTFSVDAKISGAVTKDGFALKFRPGSTAGQSYVFAVAEANMPAVTIAGAKANTNAVGNGPCRWSGFVNDDEQTVTLSQCNLIGTKIYYAFVYVEDGHNRDDGTLSPPVAVVVPPSNMFSKAKSTEFAPVSDAYPRLAATPSTSTVKIEFRANVVPGRVWASVLPAKDAVSASIVAIKTAAGAKCSVASQETVDDFQTITLSNCDLTAEVLYRAIVFVEDTGEKNDGELSTPLDVPVPSSQVTNTFIANPRLSGNVTSDTISINYAGSNADGRMWAVVVTAAVGICTSVRDIKFLVGSFCHLWNVPISDKAQVLTMEGCNLQGGGSYNALVYVEDAFGGDDGTLSQPVPFLVPATNEFTAKPVVVPKTPSPDGVVVQYTPEKPGRAWTMLVTTPHAEWVDKYAMKAGTYSVGGPQCKQNMQVTGEQSVQATLRGCSLRRGLEYKAFTYVEGANTSYVDGTLSPAIDVPVQAVSFSFVAGPKLTATPSADTIPLSFTAEANDDGPSATSNGTLWAMVSTVLNAPYVNTVSIKTHTGALGASSCRIAAQNIHALEPMSLSLTGCQLQHSTTYKAAIYVEDTLGRNDGSLEFVTIVVPPGIGNSFESFPEIVGNITNNNVSVQFTSRNPKGKAWVTVVASGLARRASPNAVISGLNAMGDANCRLQGKAITSSVSTFDLKGCNLAHQPSEMALQTNYAILVYIASEGGHADGVVAAAHFTTPPSNDFASAPEVIGTPSPDGTTLRFTPSEAGKVWIILTLPMHAASVQIATVKASGTYALGSVTCMVLGDAMVVKQQDFSLSKCAISYASLYKAFIYIEDANGLGDGTLSEPVDVQVPGSNTFAADPAVFGTPTTASVAISFASALPGKAWVAISTAAMATTMDSFGMKAGTAVCQVMNRDVPAGPETVSVSGCSLQRGVAYRAFVYLEAGSLPGTLSKSVIVTVPTSNSFSITPAISSGPTQAGVGLSFTAAMPGKAWGVVVKDGDAASVSVASIKAGTYAVSSTCKKLAQVVATGAVQQLMNFPSCNFEMNSVHKAFIYVEDGAGGSDGALSDAIDVALPASNSFSVAPYLYQTSDTDGPTIYYSAAGPGKLWATLVTHTGNVTADDIKAGTNAKTVASCRTVNQVADTSGNGKIVWTGCAMPLGGSFTAHIYVEDSGGRGDGTSAFVSVRVPSAAASNMFLIEPRLEGSPTGDGLSLSFNASYTGTVYAVVVPTGTDVSIPQVVQGGTALPTELCRKVLPLGAEETTIALTGCRLVGGTAYEAYVYVDGGDAKQDGWLSNPVDVSVPLSNSFSVDPVVTKVDGDGITASFTATEGLLWAAIWPSDAAVDFRNPFGQQCSQNGVTVTNNTDTIALTGCSLLAGVEYSFYIYVESDGPRTDDGQLFILENVTVPVANAFTSKPAVVLGSTPLATDVRVAFTASSSGKGWVKVLALAAPLYTDVVKLLTHSTEHIFCETGDVAITAGAQVVEVSSCTFTHGLSYSVYTYVTGGTGLSDGTLAGPLTATIAPGRSNSYSLFPSVYGTPTPFGLKLKFSTHTSGKAWAVVVTEAKAKTVDVAQIKKGNTADVICTFEPDNGTAIDAGSNTLPIDGCVLEARYTYSALTYVTNEAGGDDGTLSDPIAVVVPASNKFKEVPYLASVPTVSSATVTFTPESTGKAYFFLTSLANRNVSVVDVKAGTNAICSVLNVAISAGVQKTATVSGCTLPVRVLHVLLVYVESATGMNDGWLSEPVGVTVPASNGFLHQSRTTDAPTSDVISVNIAATTPLGKGWIQVVTEENAKLMTPKTVKSGSYALGPSSCKMMNDTVARGSRSVTLTGCALTRGNNYEAIVYVEDESDRGDGTMDPIPFFVPPSNTFLRAPALTATPTQDGVHLEFGAGAVMGRAWASIILKTSAASATIASVKAMTSAVGAAACRQSDISIGNVVLYWHLYACGLAPGTAYTLAVYVEDSNNRNDGTLTTVDVLVPSKASNYFTLYPTVASTPTTDGVKVAYNGFAERGHTWSMLLESTVTLSVTEMKRGHLSLGASACKEAEKRVDNTRWTVDFTGCGLARGVTYKAVVYIEDENHGNDGVFQMVDVTVPADASGVVDPIVRNHTDIAVTGGKGYQYHIRAVNYLGVGIKSPQSSVILAASPPAAPGLPVVASRTLTSVNLQWSAPSGLGSQIWRYRLFMSGPNDGNVYEEIYSGPDTAFTKTSLATGTIYKFRVAAVNSIGEGPPSAVRESAACMDPAAPGPIIVKTRSIYGITLEWKPPTSDGGCPITTYTLMQDGQEVARQTHTEYTVSSVVPAQSYTFMVRCRSRVAMSAYTPAVVVVAAEAPAAVTGLRITSQNSQSISLQWTSVPSKWHGGSPLTGYRIYRSDVIPGSAMSYVTWGEVNSITTKATISPVTAGTQYCFKVAALNYVAKSNPLTDQQPRMSDNSCGYAAEPPDPPPALYFTRVRAAEITVRWPPVSNNKGAAVELYELQMSKDGAVYQWAATNAASDMDHTEIGCSEGTPYKFKIRARNPVGWGDWSNEYSTICATPPGQMGAPRRVSSTRSSIKVAWIAPAMNGAAITSYTLYQATGDGAFYKVYAGAKLEFNSVGLATGTTYRFTVTATNGPGEGPRSPVESMVCAALPGKPTGVSFTHDSRTDTVVSWTPPADDGGATIVRYEVWYRLGLSKGPISTLAWSGVGTFSDILTFFTGNVIQFQVKAVNAVGEKHNVPGTPGDIAIWRAAVYANAPVVTLESSSLISVTLSWAPPTDDGGMPVEGYILSMDDGIGGPLAQIYKGTATKFARTGLATGYTYRFDVAAVTAKGTGAATRKKAVPCNVPGSVGNLRVLARSTTLIRIGWDAPASSGECPILGYTISAGTAKTALAKVGTTPTVLDTAFDYLPGSGDQAFYIRVIAENWKTRESDAFQGEVTTDLYAISASVPYAPKSIIRTGGTAVSIDLSWTLPNNDGGSAITKYWVYRNDGLGGTTFVDATNGVEYPTTTTYSVTSLTVGYYYQFRVAGVITLWRRLPTRI